MPKRSSRFQKLVTVIHACLAPDAEVEESALLRDKRTDKNREVDVLLRSKVGEYPILLAVEVVDRSRPAGTTWVEEMSAKHADLPTDKLVLVSGSGFAGPAVTKARSLGIETLTIDDAYDTDWKIALDLSRDGVFELFDLKYKCFLHLEGIDDWFAPTFGSRIHDSNRQYTTEIKNVVAYMLSEPRAKDVLVNHTSSTGERDFHITLKQRGLEFERSDGTFVPLVEICLGLEITFTATPVTFAIRRFREREFLTGQSKSNNGNLTFALARFRDGPIGGILYDAGTLKQLRPNPN
jgi:hypothetical protein